MNGVKHLFYSAKMEEKCSQKQWLPPCFYQKANGEIVRVSMVSDSEKHESSWDDVIYLGVGVFHHTESNYAEDKDHETV